MNPSIVLASRLAPHQCPQRVIYSLVKSRYDQVDQGLCARDSKVAIQEALAFFCGHHLSLGERNCNQCYPCYQSASYSPPAPCIQCSKYLATNSAIHDAAMGNVIGCFLLFFLPAPCRKKFDELVTVAICLPVNHPRSIILLSSFSFRPFWSGISLPQTSSTIS